MVHYGGRTNANYAQGMARAAAGAAIFAFPLLMTMEMWWLGFYLNPVRLFLFLVAGLLILVPLSWLVGFERTGTILEDVIDALVAFAIGALTSALMLTLFAVITPTMPWTEILGKIAVQSVPASIGAMLARDQLGGGDPDADDDHKKGGGYGRELFVMLVGATFLAFNVAPTEEMVLIAGQMTGWHALLVILLSIAILYAFAFALDFRGSRTSAGEMGFGRRLVHYGVAGYGIAILVSLYVLWTFGRTDGASPAQIAMLVTVLAFPAALGAASARLII